MLQGGEWGLSFVHWGGSSDISLWCSTFLPYVEVVKGPASATLSMRDSKLSMVIDSLVHLGEEFGDL